MKTTAKQFYTELKTTGLAACKKPIHTRQELVYIKNVLDRQQRILDLGCGYGRLTIPLAKSGYKVEGIDITPLFIKKAKDLSKKEKINIRFRVGDMRDLPYEDNRFDAIICMWSVFMELYRKSDQTKAIKEMLRVLADKGFALLEMPLPQKGKAKILAERTRKGNLWLGKISGITAMPHYAHSKKTLKDLMKKARVRSFQVFVDEFGGRERLFLQFWK
jgi:ubiquinone/menaquinone biosynthesis C-methylase UbiE